MEVEILKKKKQQALKTLEKYKTLRDEVYKNCHCPEQELVNQESYYSGSYNDTAYTEYWQECMICGRHHNEETKQHSWYG